MDGLQVVCTIIATLVACPNLSGADHEYMVKKSEPITVPNDFEIKLQCTMNIEPDKFEWKFYPVGHGDIFNPKALINLSNSEFQLLSRDKMTMQKKESVLSVVVTNKQAGDYQCLAYYGASVVASVPWRVSLEKLGLFPEQRSIDVTVAPGNTINWRCDPPDSNPEPYIDYLKNDSFIQLSTPFPTKSLIIPNITTDDTGRYNCRAVSTSNMNRNSHTFLNLKVKRNAPKQPPTFVMPPKKEYVADKGRTVFLECVAVGNPVPEVIWKKKVGIIPKERGEMVKGGLVIRDLVTSDSGDYECVHKNYLGMISHVITLKYQEAPKIDCLLNTTDVKQGENLDIECFVTGTPEPQISWFLNGFSVNNDSDIEPIGNKIYFRRVEKRHAGNLQIFARNVVETVYSSISVKVIPISRTQESSSDNPAAVTKSYGSKKPPKPSKIVPPRKPTVSRLSDESVVVRWQVTPKGLPIQFFKVQYREVAPASQHDHHSRGKGGSKWMTTNADILPHIRSYEVTNLKSDHWYRFRIAAVYSNNDNANSPSSDKFHLKRLDFNNTNPLPVPLIIKTETVNSTSVKIYWKCDPRPNISVDGFFVNYNSASSAADYMKVTVDGQLTDSYVLSHLQPETVYDIKLQSFTLKFASEFSAIMKAKTQGVASTTLLPSTDVVIPAQPPESAGISKLYVIIAAAVFGSAGVIFAIIAFLLFWRKWKQKKNSTRGDGDKTGVDEHHIQADGNQYVVGPKTAPRTNGCVPSNRITITANPLADADNKNQNMIEMSCLSSQNNNCSTVQPSASGENSPTSPRDKKIKNSEKRIRKKHNVDSNTSGENYV